MAKLRTPREIARYLESVAAGIRSGRRSTVAVDYEKWRNAVGIDGETFYIEVTRPLTIPQMRRRRRAGGKVNR